MITKLFWNVCCTFTRLYGKFQLLKYQWEKVIPKNLQNKRKYEKSPPLPKKKRGGEGAVKVGPSYDHKTLLKCVLYIYKAVWNVSASQISVRKLYLKIYKIERNMKNLKKKKKKKKRGGRGR